MEKAVFELIGSLRDKNSIEEERIISIIFSQTQDLNVANPAAALRKSGAYGAVPLFCTQEPEYEGSIDSIVRVLVTYDSELKELPVPVYLGEATRLRRDLCSDYEI